MRKYGIELNVVDEIAIVHRRCNKRQSHPSKHQRTTSLQQQQQQHQPHPVAIVMLLFLKRGE